MADERDVLDFGRRTQRFEEVLNRAGGSTQAESQDSDEDSCPAFGFLRGVRDRAMALEVRYANRNSHWFSYGCFVSGQYNPSAGLLLKFTGDMVTLVLIHGSNLDMPVNGVLSLQQAIQRNRVLWVREMDKAEIRKIGNGGPTIDRIEVAEFESQEELRAWLSKTARVFVR